MDFADPVSSTLGAHKDTMDRKFTDFQKHGAHERHMEDSRQNCLLEPQQMCASPMEHTKTRWILHDGSLTRTTKDL